MINLNPLSPFTQTPLSDCDNREIDAWCAKLCGWKKIDRVGWPSAVQSPNGNEHPFHPSYGTDWAAAGPLMERMAKMHHSGDVHLGHLGLPEDAGGWDCGRCHEEENVSEENDTGEWFVDGDTAPLAITRAFIIAAEHAAKGNDDAK